MKSTYKTARGATIDVAAIQSQHEKTIAVGNIKVNARGDELGPGGKIVKTREQIMAEHYKLQSPSVSAKSAAQKEAEAIADAAVRAEAITEKSAKVAAATEPGQITSEGLLNPRSKTRTQSTRTMTQAPVENFGMAAEDAALEPDISEEEIVAMKAKEKQ